MMGAWRNGHTAQEAEPRSSLAQSWGQECLPSGSSCVGTAGRLTVKRPFFSGVDGCSLRSSVCGSCTFSMPAPSSSFFSRAE